MSEKLYWAKTDPEGIIPSKREEDAGWDLYSCFKGDYLVLEPHETQMIGTGVACAFNKDTVMFLKERGSTAKYGLSLRAGVIDSGYRGEIVVALSNLNNYCVIILKDGADQPYDLYLPNYPKDVWKKKGEYPVNVYPASKAICQAVMLPLSRLESEEIPYEELLKMESERGTGLMGSSGK